MGNTEALLLRLDRRRSAWAATLSLLFVLLGTALVAHGGLVVDLIGCLTFFCFGGCLLVLLWATARPPVVLVVDASGVRLGGLLPSLRRSLPWDAIAGLRVYRFETAPLVRGTRMLGLVPRDPSATIWKQKRVIRTSRRMTGLPVSISARAISMELEQVIEAMRRFRPDLHVEYGEPRTAGLGKLARPSSWRHR